MSPKYPSPRKMIRLKCLHCCTDQPHEVTLCEASRCPLHPLRHGPESKLHPIPEEPRPMKAIRAKCLDCMGGNKAEVRKCEITECPLHAHRMGKNPNLLGRGAGRAFSGLAPGSTRG